MPGPVMVSLIPGMKHGHGAGWTPPDSCAFAKSVVEEGSPWCRQMDSSFSENRFSVSFMSSKPLDRALLVSTVDAGVTGSRTWTQTPAELKRDGDAWTASAALPAGTTAWFINVRSGGLTVSSEFQEANAE